MRWADTWRGFGYGGKGRKPLDRQHDDACLWHWGRPTLLLLGCCRAKCFRVGEDTMRDRQALSRWLWGCCWWSGYRQDPHRHGDRRARHQALPQARPLLLNSRVGQRARTGEGTGPVGPDCQSPGPFRSRHPRIPAVQRALQVARCSSFY